MLHNMKTCFIFLTTTLDSYKRFELIRRCGIDIDFYYAVDISVNHINPEECPLDAIIFNGLELWKNYNTIYKDTAELAYKGNPQFYLIEFWKTHKQYDYYWFSEDDIYMERGDYNEFFKTMSNIHSDLLLTEYNNKEQERNWFWYRFMSISSAYKYPVHYYLQLFRLSNRGCETISKHFNASDNAHSECAIPSIIYLRGLSTKFINLESKYRFRVSHLPINAKVLDSDTFVHPRKTY